MFALLLPLFMIGGAIVVDVGYWWANARKAQIAADACALAAARDLPQTWNRTECVHDGRDYVLTNLPPQGIDTEPLHVSTKVVSPFEGDTTLVEATVKMKVRTFFGRYVGLGGVELTRRAVAEQSVGEGRYAIYAHNNGCPTTGGTSLIFNGEHHTINGRVHSNGEYRVQNSDNTPPYEPFWAQEGTIFGTCYNDNPSDSAHFGGTGYAGTTQTEPTQVTPKQNWPAWWTPAQLGWTDDLDAADTCDVKGKSIEIKEESGGTRIFVDTLIGSAPAGGLGPFPGATIPHPYVYCAWEKFTINRVNLVATMSVLAPEITVDGDGQRLTAYKGNAFGEVLFFSVPNITSQSDGAFGIADGGVPGICSPPPGGAKVLTLNGNNHQWTGTIFAPCSRVKVNVGGTTAGSSHITGTILGYEVEVNGKDFVMEGRSKFGGTVLLALDQ